MSNRLCALALALCVCAGSPPLFAQETVNSASVSGRVTDQQGAVVPGAQVSARQTETNVIRETVTDQDGRFRFPYLKVGRYEITVRLQLESAYLEHEAWPGRRKQRNSEVIH